MIATICSGGSFLNARDFRFFLAVKPSNSRRYISSGEEYYDSSEVSKSENGSRSSEFRERYSYSFHAPIVLSFQ